MQNQMELVDLSRQTVKPRHDKKPPMLEVLHFLSYETPSGIRLTNLQFNRFKEALPEQVLPQYPGGGFQYEVHITGEFFSPYTSGERKLEGYLDNLNNQKFFKLIKILQKNEDFEKRMFSFVLVAYI